MTDWGSYLSYQCENCEEYCINKFGQPWTDNNLCRSCNIPALEDAAPLQPSDGEGGKLVDAEQGEASISAERTEAETDRPVGSGGLPPTRKPSRTPPSEAPGAFFMRSRRDTNLASQRGDDE